MENFKEKFDRIVVQSLGVKHEQITPRAKFKDDLGADSLDMVELVLNFENEFGVSIPDEELDKIKTVAQAETYLLGMALAAHC